MIVLQDVYLQFGHKIIFEDLNWHIKKNQKIALVGKNGAGKTTLFRILMNEQETDKGDVIPIGTVKIAYLPQEQVNFGTKTVIEEIMEGNEELNNILHQIIELEHNLNTEANLKKYAHLNEKFEVLGGFEREYKAKKILSGMGFKDSDFIRNITEFSGGYKMRIYLGKLLLDNPDLLLMDEPTNHLDLPALIWLEQYLNTFQGTVIIISHDREFINKIATNIAEIDYNIITDYPGNYDDFVKQKEEKAEFLIKMQEKQLDEIEHLSDFVEKFRYKASKATQAQSKLRQLEKIKANLVNLPQKKEKISFKLPEFQKSGNDVLTIKNLTKKYGDLTIFNNSDLFIERGERIAIVGQNGIGKTTLLKIIASLTEYAGECKLGHNVLYSYFGQHQVDELDVKKTLIEEVESVSAMDDIPKIRTLLGCFMFHGDDAYQKVLTLSGGEKSRVALAKMLLKKGNLLLLDEPTNHLDIDSKDVLMNSLKNYSGTIIFVSHDRYFIKELATAVVSIENTKIVKYIGGYDYYLSKITQTEELNKKEADFKKSSDKSQKKAEAVKRQEKYKVIKPIKDKFDKVEAEILKFEEIKSKQLETIQNPDFYSKNSSETISKLQREMVETEIKLKSLTEEWEILYMQMEEIEESFKE